MEIKHGLSDHIVYYADNVMQMHKSKLECKLNREQYIEATDQVIEIDQKKAIAGVKNEEKNIKSDAEEDSVFDAMTSPEKPFIEVQKACQHWHSAYKLENDNKLLLTHLNRVQQQNNRESYPAGRFQTGVGVGPLIIECTSEISTADIFNTVDLATITK